MRTCGHKKPARLQPCRSPASALASIYLPRPASWKTIKSARSAIIDPFNRRRKDIGVTRK